VPTYDPQKTSVTFDGNTIIGYGGSTFMKAARNEEAYVLTVGADGRSCRTRNANRSGRMEITLLASSPANDVLQSIAIEDELNADGVGSFLFKDASGTALAAAQNAWVVKIPDLERAKELGEVTWVIETDLLNIQQGGTTQAPPPP
jgi:hypothetical protein